MRAIDKKSIKKSSVENHIGTYVRLDTHDYIKHLPKATPLNAFLSDPRIRPRVLLPLRRWRHRGGRGVRLRLVLPHLLGPVLLRRGHRPVRSGRKQIRDPVPLTPPAALSRALRARPHLWPHRAVDLHPGVGGCRGRRPRLRLAPRQARLRPHHQGQGHDQVGVWGSDASAVEAAGVQGSGCLRHTVDHGQWETTLRKQ